MRVCVGWDLAKCIESMTANAEVATILRSISASSDTVESEGQEMKQCWIQYIEKNLKIPLLSLRWLNNAVGMHLIQVSFLLIGQQCLGHFFRSRPLLPIGWRIVQILRQRRRKTTNIAPTTLSRPYKIFFCQKIIESSTEINKCKRVWITWRLVFSVLTLF